MIIDGIRLAKQLLDNLKKEIGSREPPLQLAALSIGADASLKKFVELKKKAAESIGILFSYYEFSEKDDEREIIKSIRYLSDDPTVHGILVELPLPQKFNTHTILNAIAWTKDVDVLSSGLELEYYSDQLGDIMPPAVLALKNLLSDNNIKLRDKKAVVFGHGKLVGKPIAHWLEVNGAEVSIIDEFTANQEASDADIVISGVGKPGLIKGDMIKKDAIVIDYGYGREDGIMKGDVDFESVNAKASLITPVPGGMGPLVIEAVLENLLLFQKKEK